jgi:hypothetical protein
MSAPYLISTIAAITKRHFGKRSDRPIISSTFFKEDNDEFRE